MLEIGMMYKRLGVAADLAGALVAAWDCFAVVQETADGCADRAPELFAAFLFAAAAAAEGREAVGFAPSMPASPGPPTGPIAPGHDAQEIAGQLAGLAAVLHSTLQTAALQAGAPDDRQACQHAAAQALLIGDLLAPARR
jgi:hypothetical protein